MGHGAADGAALVAAAALRPLEPTGWACAALLLLGSAWGVGFGVFERAARAPAPASQRKADGIVALTGGADRIETALHLLQAEQAPALLVSGVGRGVDLAEMMRRVRLAPALEARITLGRQATSTLGNAAKRRNGRGRPGPGATAGGDGRVSHGPGAARDRAGAARRGAGAGTPVQPPALRGTMDMETTRILASEFDKYLVARFGPYVGAGAAGGGALIWVRSALFNVWFFGATFVWGSIGAFVRAFRPERSLWVAQSLGRAACWRWRGEMLCGIRDRRRGRASTCRTGAALIASQHQSAFDTLIWLTAGSAGDRMYSRPSWRSIPLFGSHAEVPAGQIPVDRGASLQARCKSPAAAAPTGRRRMGGRS